MSGKKIIQQNELIQPGSTPSINISALAPGCYYIQAMINGTNLQQKFLKER